MSRAKETWEAQCLKRGVEQRGWRWEVRVEGEPPVKVPNMVPNEASRTLPTREVAVAFEEECAAAAAVEGITTSEYRRRMTEAAVVAARAAVACPEETQR